MKQVKQMHKKQRGFTLVEIGIVLALAGLIYVVVSSSRASGFSSNDVKDEQTQIIRVLGALPELRGSAGYGAAGTDLLPVLIDQKVVQVPWKVISGTVTNTFGGTVAITSNDGATAKVIVTKYPQEACNRLARGLSRGDNFFSSKINAGTVHVGEVTTVQAQADCTTGANTIEWITAN